MYIASALIGSAVMDSFHLVLLEDMDRILGSVRPSCTY